VISSYEASVHRESFEANDTHTKSTAPLERHMSESFEDRVVIQVMAAHHEYTPDASGCAQKILLDAFGNQSEAL